MIFTAFDKSCVFFFYSCRMSFVSPLVFFSEARLLFSGAPAARPWCSPVFLLPRTQLARFFQRWVSSGHFPGRFFFVFRCLGLVFWSPGGLLCSFFASWIRKGTYLCQLAPPGHQLGGKWGHQVDSPPPGVAFRTIFLTFPDF